MQVDRPVPTRRPSIGRVTSFESARGVGTVVDSHGDVFDFHAIAIADGSRTIEVGTDVTFAVVPGRRGRYEADTLIALG